jgi:predicted dehydrogenase
VFKVLTPLSAQSLIEAPEVEAVLVASNDATHAQYVLSSMAAGKPVLCEEPLAPTLPAIEAYLCAHEEHLYFAGVVVEFTSQTGLNPETPDRAAGT